MHEIDFKDYEEPKEKIKCILWCTETKSPITVQGQFQQKYKKDLFTNLAS